MILSPENYNQDDQRGDCMAKKILKHQKIRVPLDVHQHVCFYMDEAFFLDQLV